MRKYIVKEFFQLFSVLFMQLKLAVNGTIKIYENLKYIFRGNYKNTTDNIILELLCQILFMTQQIKELLHKKNTK